MYYKIYVAGKDLQLVFKQVYTLWGLHTKFNFKLKLLINVPQKFDWNITTQMYSIVIKKYPRMC